MNFCSPSGWDNMKKISILYENLVSMKPDDYYRNIISPPASARKVNLLLTKIYYQFTIKDVILYL